jgi:3-hydroxyisobutyrate dehydrogenase-like beta-hydroxyacid dehydrogenase
LNFSETQFINNWCFFPLSNGAILQVYPPSMERFVKAGGEASSSPHEAVQGAQVVVLMVTNQDQAQSVLYGPDGAVPALSKGAAVVLCSTVSPDYVRQLETQLAG